MLNDVRVHPDVSQVWVAVLYHLHTGDGVINMDPLLPPIQPIVYGSRLCELLMIGKVMMMGVVRPPIGTGVVVLMGWRVIDTMGDINVGIPLVPLEDADDAFPKHIDSLWLYSMMAPLIVAVLNDPLPITPCWMASLLNCIAVPLLNVIILLYSWRFIPS